MSIVAGVVEGARRAALYAALLFAFDVGTAAAQPTAVPTSAAIGNSTVALATDSGLRGQAAAGARDLPPLPIAGSVADSGLTLAAHHVDVHVTDGVASARTWLFLRNDTARAISAQYVLPYPARLSRGDGWSVDELCGDDLSVVAAELAEAAEAPLRQAQRHDVIVVAAGEQVTLQVEREVPIISDDAVHRLSLPLPVNRDALWVPRFSADVFIEAERPIRRLVSPTHEALVDGIGEHAALLSVDGFVYRQAQLAVEYELDSPARKAPVRALDRAPATAAR